MYYRNNDCARAAARIFNAQFPDKNVQAKYVIELVRKFDETGSVQNKRHNRSRSMTNEEMQIGVLGLLEADRTQIKSIRKLSEESGVRQTSVHTILKLAKYYPYKISLVQELNEDDYDRRTEFCELMSNRILENRNIVYNICFSDECTFALTGAVNKHNCRYWSNENPHLYREDHTQRPQKLNVWAGILGNSIIGPIFINETLTGEVYRDLLQNTVNPLIMQVIREDENLIGQEVFFQQDGAPPHYYVRVRQYLDQTFPARWIGRRGPIEWPARSPDLTPLDFFFWGHLKTKVYTTKPNDLEDLRERIVRESRLITPEMLQAVREKFEHNLYHCMEVGGGHFQHLG